MNLGVAAICPGSPPPCPANDRQRHADHAIGQPHCATKRLRCWFRGMRVRRHSLKCGAQSAGMAACAHAGQLKRLGRHKSFDVLGGHLEFGNLLDGHALSDNP